MQCNVTCQGLMLVPIIYLQASTRGPIQTLGFEYLFVVVDDGDDDDSKMIFFKKNHCCLYVLLLFLISGSNSPSK